jgi:hypothetical protein
MDIQDKHKQNDHPTRDAFALVPELPVPTDDVVSAAKIRLYHLHMACGFTTPIESALARLSRLAGRFAGYQRVEVASRRCMRRCRRARTLRQ